MIVEFLDVAQAARAEIQGRRSCRPPQVRESLRELRRVRVTVSAARGCRFQKDVRRSSNGRSPHSPELRPGRGIWHFRLSFQSFLPVAKANNARPSEYTSVADPVANVPSLCSGAANSGVSPP